MAAIFPSAVVASAISRCNALAVSSRSPSPRGRSPLIKSADGALVYAKAPREGSRSAKQLNAISEVFTSLVD